jgi:hypothetical protein
MPSVKVSPQPRTVGGLEPLPLFQSPRILCGPHDISHLVSITMPRSTGPRQTFQRGGTGSGRVDDSSEDRPQLASSGAFHGRNCANTSSSAHTPWCRLSNRDEEQTEASPSPGLFRVFGVEQGDVLNVRDRPNTDGKIVAQIPPDARKVEVRRCAGDSSERWCKVTYAGATGWVNAGFLRHLATGAAPQ